MRAPTGDPGNWLAAHALFRTFFPRRVDAGRGTDASRLRRRLSPVGKPSGSTRLLIDCKSLRPFLGWCMIAGAFIDERPSPAARTDRQSLCYILITCISAN
jgi:hypothetical protein